MLIWRQQTNLSDEPKHALAQWGIGGRMATYDDNTPAYSPSTPYYDTGAPAPSQPFNRTPRRGPLSSRLEARSRNTAPPASIPPSGDDFDTPSTSGGVAVGRTTGAPHATAPLGGDDAGPAWSSLTQAMREPNGLAEMLRASHEFDSRWSTRADMLGACLDEYYKLTSSVNDARKLLQDTERDITTLRQQQFTAYMTLRELEAHLEMHSRMELRSAYLGAAEIEMRVFRGEQDRDMLTSRIEMLEGFMQFLSRVIATVRGISPDAMELSTSVSVAQASEPTPAMETESRPESDYEELEVYVDEAEAMIASGEVEVVGMVEEVDTSAAQSSKISAPGAHNTVREETGHISA